MHRFRNNIWVAVVACSFISLIFTALIITAFILLAIHFNLIEFSLPFRRLTIILFLLFCILLGTIISAISSRLIVNPFNQLISAIRRVSHGDFSVQVDSEEDSELGLLTQEFNKMVQELNSIETLRNDFVANVSHEFKTPIATIEGCTLLLQDENLPPEERKEYINIISESSRRLSILTTNILKLSKLENQEIVPEQNEFDLDEQLRLAVLMQEPQWSEKNIAFDIDLSPVKIFSSEELLMLVWQNIIGNAIKFSPENSTIYIAISERHGEISVSIRDEGIGMEQEVLEHIFDKFYQGDKSHSIYGNGLGLSLVYRIISLLGGNISVKSTPGVGSTFTVTLKNNLKLLPKK